MGTALADHREVHPGLDSVTPPLPESKVQVESHSLHTTLSVLYCGRLCMLALAMFSQLTSQPLLRRWLSPEMCLQWRFGVPLACHVCWRAWVRAHMLRHLRLRRIAPLLLHKRLKSGEQ